MKKTLVSAAFAALALLAVSCGSAKQTSYLTPGNPNPQDMASYVASGNNVYIDWVDAEGGLSSNEYKDFVRLTKEYTLWKPVESKADAHFVLRLIQNKRMVLTSPACWLTPEILTPDGRLLWRGEQVRADADLGNGFRATDACFKKMLKKDFLKEPVLVAALTGEDRK